MGKNKKLMIALPVLLAVSILVWLPNFKSSARKTAKKSAVSEIVFPSRAELVSLFDISSGRDAGHAAWGERDPFDASALEEKVVEVKAVEETVVAPASVENTAEDTKEEAVINYDLKGIFWNATKPSAIINDSVVGIGSVVDLATVKDIQEACDHFRGVYDTTKGLDGYVSLEINPL